MKHFLYTVKDSVAGTTMSPFLGVKDAVAIRYFSTAVNDDQSAISKNPGDFALYRIGEYDDETMILVATNPEIISQGSILKVQS